MGDRNRSTVRMNFGDGSKIDAWLQFSLRDTYTDPLGQLDFTTAPIRERISDYRQRLRKGELVTVLANEVNQGTFLITTSKMLISKDAGVIFQITCKSPLATSQEGSVNPKLSFASESDAALADVILEALEPYGLNTIASDAAANVSALTGRSLTSRGGKVTTERFKTSEAQAQDNERAYQFCARLLSRRGVALRTTVEGTLLLGAPNYDQETAYTLVQDFDGSLRGDRFIDTVEVTDTNDEQYSECRVRGLSLDRRGRSRGQQPVAIVTSAEMFPNRPAYSGGVGSEYKRLDILDKDSRDVEQCRSVAKHALGMRARNAFTVTGEVDGFVSSTGRIWQVDTLARTIVQAYDLDEEMWVLERVLTQDVEGGQKTRLTLIPKGALVLGEEAG
jgi:hypothetical protein